MREVSRARWWGKLECRSKNKVRSALAFDGRDLAKATRGLEGQGLI